LNTIYFEVSITVGSTTITKSIRLLTLPDYSVKEIAFSNNFGLYQYAYLDGQLSIDNNLEVLSFEQQDNSIKIFEINESFNYSINTGSLLASEKEIISSIVNSLDTKIYLNAQWMSMNTTTKKIKNYQDKINNYSETLTFNVIKNTSVTNIGFGAIAPSLSRISLLDVVVTGNDIEVTFALDSGYSPSAVTFYLVKSDGTTSTDTGSPVSPRTEVDIPVGTWTLYLKEIETGIISNGITFTIV